MRSKPALCFHTDALSAGPDPNFFSEFYRGLGGNIFLQGRFCAEITVDLEDLCNKYLFIKTT